MFGQPIRYGFHTLKSTGHSLADSRSAEQFILSSSIDWTIVRPTALNDNSETNKVHIARNKDYFQSGPDEISSEIVVILENLRPIM
ncbi:NAD(P)H-binding protein [Oceanobacillus sp. CFH 90083]|uniref:NAD(P)H-binding protein n=1 Tax=Oceanobacillus sp. CFH 90083 TaxID=2592336 RepID=UPI00128E6D10|nr:NAD(P)H-binding protein [Oceanobacillus sp. CFH 90083]